MSETKTELMLPGTPSRKIIQVTGRLVTCLERLSSAKAVPINGEQLAKARIYNGKESEIYQKTSLLIGYDQIRLPYGDLLMTLPEQSVVLENPRRAITQDRTEGQMYLAQNQLDALLERASTDLAKARKSGVLRISKSPFHERLLEIPTNRYCEHIEPLFVYGAEAKAYGDFLNQQGIESTCYNAGGTDQRGACVYGTIVYSPVDGANIDYIHIGSGDTSRRQIFGVKNAPTAPIASQ